MTDDAEDDDPEWYEKIDLGEDDIIINIETLISFEDNLAESDLRVPNINKADLTVLLYLFARTADVPANIAEASDYNRTYIHQRLSRLEEWGLVHNRGNGVYELDDDVRDIYDGILEHWR